MGVVMLLESIGSFPHYRWTQRQVKMSTLNVDSIRDIVSHSVFFAFDDIL